MVLEPEDTPLPGLVQGLMVVVEYMAGPEVTEENSERVSDGEVLSGPAEARTARVFLEAYSRYGIEVSKWRGAKPTVLIPWASVLAIYTEENREELIRMYKEDIADSHSEQPE